MNTSLWINNPTILLNKNYIMDIWPTQNMFYEQKVNAITRFIIFISILGFIFTMKYNILLIGIATLAVIWLVLKMKKPKVTKKILEEGFVVNEDKIEDLYPKKTITDPVTLETIFKENYKEGTKKNPFSNVLITDYEDDPTRKAAPPSFNVDIDHGITKNVKKTVQFLNPDIKNTNKQLFSSLTDQFYLDQSNRAFFSTPNTKIPNDQKAFAEYLYGYMPSAKESTPEGNLQRIADNYRYQLY